MLLRSVGSISGHLAQEDGKFWAYLVSKGWRGEMGEDDLKALADEGVPQAMVEDVKKA